MTQVQTTEKDRLAEKEKSVINVRSLDNDELYKETNHARSELVKIIEASRDESNPEAIINWEKAEAELGEKDLNEKAIKLRKVVDAGAQELSDRYDAVQYEKTLAQGFERVPVPSAQEKTQAVLKHDNMFDYLASKESKEFQDVYGSRKNLKQVEENYANVGIAEFVAAGQYFGATNTTGNTISVNRNRDEGRPIVTYNDPMIPIHSRLPIVRPINGGDSYTFIKELGAGGDGNKKGNTVGNVAEEGEYPEQEYQTKNVTVVVEKVAAFSAVTDEQLEDVAQARTFIQGRLVKNFNQKVESQVINGTGSSNQWLGLTAQANIQSVTKTGAIKKLDIFIDAHQKLIGTAYVTPNILAMPSATHSLYAKLKDADGNYMWASVVNGLPNQILGVPITISEHLTANTAIMLNSSEFALLDKRGMMVEWGMTDGDFRKGRKSVRASCRGNVLAWRQNAVVNLKALNTADA